MHKVIIINIETLEISFFFNKFKVASSLFFMHSV